MSPRQFLGIVNLPVQVVNVSPFVLGTLLAVTRLGRFHFAEALLMGAASIAIGSGVTAFNSFFDYRRGVDNGRFNRSVDKVLVNEAVAPGIALLSGLGLFAFGSLLGLVLSFIVGWKILAVGAACQAIGFLYSGGPYPLSRTPFGEVLVGLAQGSGIFALSYFVQARFVDTSVLFFSLPSAFFVASILTVNNNCDREGDGLAGRRTLSILVGTRASRVLVPLMGAAGWGFAFASVFPHQGTVSGLIVAAGAIASAPLYAAMDRRAYSHATKAANMGGIIGVFLIFSVAMGLALLSGRA